MNHYTQQIQGRCRSQMLQMRLTQFLATGMPQITAADTPEQRTFYSSPLSVLFCALFRINLPTHLLKGLIMRLGWQY